MTDYNHSRRNSVSKGDKRDDNSRGYSSNSGLFDKRGDAWVTPKQGLEDFGRSLESENPDFDRYFAKESPERERAAETRSVARKERQKIEEAKAGAEEVAALKKLVNIRIGLNRRIKGRQ